MWQLSKFDDNPLLVPDEKLWFESGAVFNPSAEILPDGRVAMLYRAIPAKYEKTSAGVTGEYVSYLGLAYSNDGHVFTKRSEPVMSPDAEFDRWGCEDPRIVRIPGAMKTPAGDPYFVTYTAISRSLTGGASHKDSVRLALASTVDLESFTKHGVIGPPLPDKDAVFIPRLFNGKFALLHRIEPNIQLAWFDDFEQLCNPPASYWADTLEHLDDHVVMRPEFEWEALKIGAGPTPIETEEGWLLLYHGVDEHRFYRGGAALLDLDDPSKVIARCPHPILEPTESFETNGDVPNVVFPEGAVCRDGELIVYYGGGDTCVCGASARLSELVDYLLRFKT